MQNNLEVHGGRNRSPLYLALIVLLFGSGVAAADGTAPAAANAIGVMSFPNVRVVNTPELASSSAPAANRPDCARTSIRSPVRCVSPRRRN